MTHLSHACESKGCHCTRASLCEPCWKNLERSMTEAQLRQWFASWSQADARNDGVRQAVDDVRD